MAATQGLTQNLNPEPDVEHALPPENQSPTDGQGDPSVREFRAGCMAALDFFLVIVTGACFISVFIFFCKYRQMKWIAILLALLVFIAVLGLVSCCQTRGSASTPDRSFLERAVNKLLMRTVDKYLILLPFAQMCFYALFITRGDGSCGWFIAVGTEHVSWFRVLFLTSAWISILNLALIALDLDKHASVEVMRRVRDSPSSALVYVAFRASELALRLIMSVLLCEVVRQALGWHPLLMMLLPFILDFILYATILQSSNWTAHDIPSDSIWAVAGVAFVTLGLNPFHLFRRSHYLRAAKKAKNRIFACRMFELACFFALLVMSWYNGPEGCLHDQTIFKYLLSDGGATFGQLVAALVVYYGIVCLNSGFRPSRNEANGSVSVAYDSRTDSLSRAPLPQVSRGLCEALLVLQFGLLRHLSGHGAEELNNMESFSLTQILGRGSYGVVVKASSGNLVVAMKLLDTRRFSSMRNLRPPAELFQRELDINRRIWCEGHETGSGSRFGHPFIAKLLFYCNWEGGKYFVVFQNDAYQQVTMDRGSSGSRSFDKALIFEFYADGTLDKYLESGFQAGFQRFLEIRQILAELALALSFLHDTKGIVHRDIKLDNILMVQARLPGGLPHIKLADFGFSKFVGDPDLAGPAAPAGSGHDAADQSLAGSPYWCAPEMLDVARGRRLLASPREEKALDVYSFGVVAFALAHGPTYKEVGGNPLRSLHHPRCLRRPPGGGDGCPCSGCQARRSIGRGFDTEPGQASIVDCVKRCVANSANDRPATAELCGLDLFTQPFRDARLRDLDVFTEVPRVDFQGLQSLEI